MAWGPTLSAKRSHHAATVQTSASGSSFSPSFPSILLQRAGIPLGQPLFALSVSRASAGSSTVAQGHKSNWCEADWLRLPLKCAPPPLSRFFCPPTLCLILIVLIALVFVKLLFFNSFFFILFVLCFCCDCNQFIYLVLRCISADISSEPDWDKYEASGITGVGDTYYVVFDDVYPIIQVKRSATGGFQQTLVIPPVQDEAMLQLMGSES